MAVESFWDRKKKAAAGVAGQEVDPNPADSAKSADQSTDAQPAERASTSIDYTSVCQLLRTIRNYAHHVEEDKVSQDVKALLTPKPDKFVSYFTSKFPR